MWIFTYYPVIIINKIYKNQNLLYVVPLIKHTIVVCIRSMSPIARGCFICVNINPVIVLSDISNFVMSGGILFKILILGINEMGYCLSSEVLKGYSLSTGSIFREHLTPRIFTWLKLEMFLWYLIEFLIQIRAGFWFPIAEDM